MPRLATLLALTTGLLACRAAIPPWGTSLESAKRNADNALAAFAFRFHNVQRDPRFAAARPEMGRYALIPGRLYRDTSLWTRRNDRDSVRSLTLAATHSDSGFRFTSTVDAPLPARVGDERHRIELRRKGDDDYEWFTDVAHAIGPVRPAQVADALGALFTAFEGRRDAELLADADAAFPETRRQLGRLVALDSLRSTPLADGSTRLAMHVTFRPDSLRGTLPSFAAYLDKYFMPSVYHVVLTDHQGAPYLDLSQRDGTAQVLVRAHGGHLVSLTGPARPLPDSLLIRLDFSAKFKLFRVGYTDLVGDFTIERGDHVRAWVMRFRREPAWHFPLAIDKLIKSPLRRPFEGAGSELTLGVRDDAPGQTLSFRIARLTVRESTIMRWLNSLGGTAFGDFSGRAELEEDRFLLELFGALRKDFQAALP
jgi:hypothetical protein